MPLRTAALDKQSTLEWAVGAPLMIVCIILGAIALRWLVVRAIDRAVHSMEIRQEPQRSTRAGRALRRATGLDSQRRKQRAATMGSILRSVATMLIFGITALTVMARLGVPLAPLLASAGVGGVALGFGAQSLVKDFLSGIFMIMEDQYGVGDVVDTGQTIGTVEEVTLRVTRIRDFEGVVWYIRNGEILRIGNKSQGYATTFVDIPIGIDQSVEKGLQVLRRVAAEMDDESPWKERLLDEPIVAGVQEMTNGAVTLRIIATCIPNEQYGVAREIRERSKMALDEAGVRGPQLPPYGPTIGT